MKGKTILIIDDDSFVCEQIKDSLAAAEAYTFVAPNGVQGLRDFYKLRPDLVLLDVMLPDRKGTEVLRHIRRLADVPVIILSAVENHDEIVRCLNAGADDYVTKPINERTLVTRVDIALCRSEAQMDETSSIYDDGNLIVDPVAFRVLVKGQQVKLTATEFDLLTFLIHNAGRACTFTQILANVWGERYRNNSEYVHAFIWQLRRKLERDPKRPDYLVSVHGVGYRFESRVVQRV